jgi:hypothetical protein
MAKGLSAEEIVGRFTGGVTGAGAKWEERTLAGAGRYTSWVNTWYPGLLAILPGVYRTVDPYERVRRVGEYTKGKAKAYKAGKVAALAGLARGASPTPA